MTAYEEFNLPDDLNTQVLPMEFFTDTKKAILEALEKGQVVAVESRAAYVYDRSGYLSFDSFAESRIPHYSSSDDDVVLQVTIRVKSPNRFRAEVPLISKLAKDVAAHKLEEE